MAGRSKGPGAAGALLAAAAFAVSLLLASCGGGHKASSPEGGAAGGKQSSTITGSGAVEGAEGGNGGSGGIDTGLVLRGEDVGVCVGIESGDVLNSDGQGNLSGQFFWDPLHLESEVQHQGLGGISAYGNQVSLYFWPSTAKASQVLDDARAKKIHDVRRIGNADVVGMSSLEPSARSVVNDCLTNAG